MKKLFGAVLLIAGLVSLPRHSTGQTTSFRQGRAIASCLVTGSIDFLRLSAQPAHQLTFGLTTDTSFKAPGVFILVYKDDDRSHGELFLTTFHRTTGRPEVNIQNNAGVTRKGNTFDFTDEAPRGGVWTQSRFIRAARLINSRQLSTEKVANLRADAQNYTCISQLLS